MLPPKLFKFGSDARAEMLDGIDLLRRAVTATLGPNGRNVAIDRYSVVDSTKDGVTVMHDVVSPEPFKQMGIKMAQESSSKTNDEAGDGTTTAVEITWAIATEGNKFLQQGTNVIKLNNGIKKAVKVCEEELEKMAVKVTEQKQYVDVATIASQDEEIGKKVADIFAAAGENGIVDIERVDKPGIETEHTDGMQFEEGWFRPEFINDWPSLSCVLEDCPVMITDRALTGNQELIGLENLAKRGIKKCLVIADDFSGEALASLAKNARIRTFQCVAVKAPAYGRRKMEILKDIAAMTGATIISEEFGKRLDKMTIEDFGKARHITVKQSKTIITAEEGHEEDVNERVEGIKKEMEEMEESFEKDKLRERLASLTDGVSIVKLGANTEIERILLKRKVEDAIRAVQAAKAEGIVAGGGTALLRCMPAVKALADSLTNQDERMGAMIVHKALEAPAKRILEVAGMEDGLIVETVKKSEGSMGYDMENGTYVDLLEKGVADPKKVVRCALVNGASCATIFLSTEVAITPKPKDEDKDKA